MKYTITDFHKEFPDEESCVQEIFNRRYGALKNCPKCKRVANFFRVRNRKCYSCQFCGYQLHPLAGTIFHKSPTPLKLWFYAIYLFSASRNGVAAKELQRQLGVTYKTAWRIAKQVRALMGENGNDKLSGTVEVDETYVGGKMRGGKRGLGSENKTSIFGAVERRGNVKAVVTKIKSRKVIPIIQRTVITGSNVMSDQFRMYRNLPRFGFKHESVNHGAKEYVRGNVHTNTIEGFWSQLKRSIDGAHITPFQKSTSSPTLMSFLGDITTGRKLVLLSFLFWKGFGSSLQCGTKNVLICSVKVQIQRIMAAYPL